MQIWRNEREHRAEKHTVYRVATYYVKRLLKNNLNSIRLLILQKSTFKI